MDLRSKDQIRIEGLTSDRDIPTLYVQEPGDSLLLASHVFYLSFLFNPKKFHHLAPLCEFTVKENLLGTSEQSVHGKLCLNALL